MKKLLVLLGLIVLIAMLISCGDNGDTTGATPDSTPADTTAESNVRSEATKWYTGILSDEYDNALKGDALKTDLSAYEFFGAANDVTLQVNNKYQNRKWFIESKDGTKTASSYQEVRKLSVIAAKVTANGANNEITVKEIDVQVIPKYEKITAQTGSYLMLDFYSNVPAFFSVTVTKKAGDKNAIYTEKQIPVETDRNGITTGLAKFTVPHTGGTTFYLNILMGSNVVASMPIETVQGSYATNICQAWVEGPWELVEDREVVHKILYEFYACFPTILSRFAIIGNEPRVITIYVEDNNDIGAAWASGDRIGICLDWLNSTSHELKDIGFLSHELGHSAQQFGDKLNYGDQQGRYYEGKFWGGWFTEQMASYSGFRYWHWGTVPEAVDLEVFDPARNYYFDWTSYGNCGLFFAYVDWHWPTFDKNNDGKITDNELGVIDALYKLIKNTTTKLYDTPHDPDTPFNQTVRAATVGSERGEFHTIGAIYDAFVADLKSGVWTFTGYADYKDNFLTESIPGHEDPDYPVYKAAEHGNVTNEAKLQTGVKADTVVLPQGENIAKGSTVIQLSGKNNDQEGIEALFDGDLETNWRASQEGVNGKYVLMSVAHGFIIDLGEVKTFDTYAFVNAGISKSDTFNTSSWEVLVSTDGKNFTSIDYQEDKPADAVTVEVGTQSARYIEFRVYKTNPTSNGIVRINEMVFVKTK